MPVRNQAMERRRAHTAANTGGADQSDRVGIVHRGIADVDSKFSNLVCDILIVVVRLWGNVQVRKEYGRFGAVRTANIRIAHDLK